MNQIALLGVLLGVRPDCVQMPKNKVPPGYRPPHSAEYRVREGDSWSSIARHHDIAAWDLIVFNFPGLSANLAVAAKEVNWYLQEYVGCRKTTPDRRNYLFHGSARPGIIYVPSPDQENQCKEGSVLSGIKERRESIINNSAGKFELSEESKDEAYANPWYSSNRAEEVTGNEQKIEAEARKWGLDADFVKAIVWMESTHGWYDRVHPGNETIRPMNVHATLWAKLGANKQTLSDADKNIEIGTQILGRIWNRTRSPTYAKVATLYNSLGATKISAYGKTVAKYQASKPWKKK